MFNLELIYLAGGNFFFSCVKAALISFSLASMWMLITQSLWKYTLLSLEVFKRASSTVLWLCMRACVRRERLKSQHSLVYVAWFLLVERLGKQEKINYFCDLILFENIINVFVLWFVQCVRNKVEDIIVISTRVLSNFFNSISSNYFSTFGTYHIRCRSL